MSLFFSSNLKLILASSSPRRRELLPLLGLPFINATPSNIREAEYIDPANPDAGLAQLSLAKARSILPPQTPAYIIGADTIVLAQGQDLGKPQDRLEAQRMLTLLSGRSHAVKTGLCVLDSQRDIFLTKVITTKVKIMPLSAAVIEGYLDHADYSDKAGAYGIQDSAGVLIEKISGCYYNVVGLPLNALYKMLNRLERGH